MSKLYTQEQVEKLVELSFTRGRVFEATKALKDAQTRLDKLQPTPNMNRLHIIHLCKEKQDILNIEYAPVNLSIYEQGEIAAEEEAHLHYLNEEIQAAS